MVLVRFAYGFLNKLRLYSISVQTMPLRSAELIILRFIATTGCCPADSQAISCLLGERVYSLRPLGVLLRFLCPLRFRLISSFSIILWPGCRDRLT